MLTQAVRDATIAGDVPLAWLRNPAGRPHLRRDDEVLVDISVWRAAIDVASTDKRPTGEPTMADAARSCQNDLDARLEHLVGIEAGVWSRLLTWADPAIARDPEAWTSHSAHMSSRSTAPCGPRDEGGARPGPPARRPRCVGSLVPSGGPAQERPILPAASTAMGNRRATHDPATRVGAGAWDHQPRSRRPIHRLLNTHHEEGETMSVTESTTPGAFISLSPAADRLGISVHTLQGRIAAGELQALRTGKRIIRVRVRDLEIMLQRVPSTKLWQRTDG